MHSGGGQGCHNQNRISAPLAIDVKDYRNASDYYIYGRAPPPGFEGWLAFAKERGCALERYDTIERDLEPFRARNITAAMVWEAAQLTNTSLFSIRAGSVHSVGAGGSAVAAAYLSMLEGLARHLPDMDFVVNLYDEPRVMLGQGPAAARVATACQGISEAAAGMLTMHGFFIAGRQSLTGRALPVFSQSKVPGCFLDITIPSWTYADVAPVNADDAFGWKKRRSKLFFRGSSTGGHVADDTPFDRMHRHRLVEHASARSGSGLFDVGFVEYLQCRPGACARMQDRYGLIDRAPEDEAWMHKFVMIMDGNTFSSRLMQTLTSGSLVFRAGLFSEWFDERLVPWVHYLPVSFDLRNLDSLLAWAVTHDREAQAIADAAALQARHFIGYKDMQCYWYRLLLEYAALLQDPYLS